MCPVGKSAAVPNRFVVPALRAIWLTAPLWGGASIAAGLGGGAPASTVSALLWVGWAVSLVALLVPTTVSLTAVRVLVPGVAVGALIIGRGPWWFVAVAGAIAAVALAFAADVGHVFIDGSSYGDEHRYPLAPPAGAVLVVPIGWGLSIAGLIAGPLLVADRRWVLGTVGFVVGLPLAAITARGLHRLSRRFAVLVPAGLVVHDPITLADTALLRRPQIASVNLAAAETSATDLTGGAAGLAVEVSLAEDCIVTLAPSGPREPIEPKGVRAVMFTPSRPGRFLAACEAAGLR